jgi:hypothetical protein
MVSWNEKDGRVLNASALEYFGQSLPEIRTGIGIVEDIAHAEDGIYSVAARDVEDSPNSVHAGA